MNKSIIIVFIVFSFSVFSNDKNYQVSNGYKGVVLNYDAKQKKYNYIISNKKDGVINSYFLESELEHDNSGFQYLDIDINENYYGRCIIVSGGNQFLLYNTNGSRLYEFVVPSKKSYTYFYTDKNWNLKENHNDKYYDKDITTDHKSGIYNFGIENVEASSFYKETLNNITVDYSALGLNKRYIWIFVNEYWNSELPPWVEGVNGYGIGEWLEVSYEEPMNNIVILNGYVDFLKPHLYKDNSRVKKFKVTSEDNGEPFEFEIELEDIVKFQDFKLPRKAEKIRLEIVEVYKGNKWADTAVTGIFSLE